MKYNYSLSTRLRFWYYKCIGNKKASINYYHTLLYRDLNKYGPEILKKINQLTAKRNMSYWLTWGTLLGYYREHGIIMGDNDLDLGMFYEDITLDFVKELIENGFEFSEAIVENGYNGYHLAFNYKNVKVDLYSFKKTDDGDLFIGFAPGPYHGKWEESKQKNIYLNKWFNFPYCGFKGTQFIGVPTNVPANDRELLEILYGEHFMTPMPGYKAGPNDHIVVDDVSKSYAKRYEFSEFVDLKERKLI